MKKISALMLGVAISSNIYAQEFDFRGAILGMTLDEFKALPSINGKSFRDGKSVSCTEKKGNLECTRAGDDPFNQMYGFTTTNYLFHNNLNGQPQLYMVMMMSDYRNASLGIAGMTQKWGKGDTEIIPTTNGLGIEIKKTKVTWNKLNSEITLESPCSSLKYLCIVYKHKGIYAQILKEEKRENSF